MGLHAWVTMPKWVQPIMFAALFGAIAGLIAGQFKSNAPAPAPLLVQAAPQGLLLRVERDDPGLKLRWEGESSTVRHATHGELHITDGNHKSKLRLGADGLRAGLFSYKPETEEVEFRLDVHTPQGTVTRSAITEPAVAAKKPSPFEDPNAVRRARTPRLAGPVRMATQPVLEKAGPPKSESGLSRVIGKIPLLRRLKRDRAER
jgi:hypothetical protein